MQESAASESSPRNAHIVQGFSPAPLLQSLLPVDLRSDGDTRRWTHAGEGCSVKDAFHTIV
jgi:hypothetical protein